MMNELDIRSLSTDSFTVKVVAELKRAERYRFFVSLVALDLSFIRTLFGDNSHQVVSTLLETVQINTRVIDNLSLIGGLKLVLLLPETSRQGAEIAARRLSELIRTSLSSHSDRKIEDMIPLEMASFPDAAGTKTVKDFVRELSEQSRN